jgi:hypothetical protein
LALAAGMDLIPGNHARMPVKPFPAGSKARSKTQFK